MFCRRLLHDDSFGVGEALNEMEEGKGLVALGRHLLLTDHTLKQVFLNYFFLNSEPVLIFKELIG
jgi:hypothetical protein